LRDLPVQILIWMALAVAITAAAAALRLPERMGCTRYGGRSMHCQYSPFSPQTWSSRSTR
jgi:hypothetical protein